MKLIRVYNQNEGNAVFRKAISRSVNSYLRSAPIFGIYSKFLYKLPLLSSNPKYGAHGKAKIDIALRKMA